MASDAANVTDATAAVRSYEALPHEIRRAIYQRAKTACPDCGLQGVPQSWAVVAHQETVRTASVASAADWTPEQWRQALALGKQAGRIKSQSPGGWASPAQGVSFVVVDT